ncbi:MAG TPA: Uma2 family endonuclease [Ktedonobacteraceae bacterium]|nr:Uma2 family endonuclease [Ktedonobacteraceae bacterium]
MALEHPRTMTVAEYFQLEESDPEHRYEYIDGHVYMMAGGSLDHDMIKSNIQDILRALLRGGQCRVYSSDAKVQVSATRYLHPDVTVTCDPQDRGRRQMIQSPRLVFEVLSPGTERKDRTSKMKLYHTCPTIEEYVLVNTRFPLVERHHRENGKWVYDVFEENDEVTLVSLDVHFPCAAVYEDIEFSTEE